MVRVSSATASRLVQPSEGHHWCCSLTTFISIPSLLRLTLATPGLATKPAAGPSRMSSIGNACMKEKA